VRTRLWAIVLFATLGLAYLGYSGTENPFGGDITLADTAQAAGRPLLVGIDDDSLKWGHAAAALADYRDLGLGAVRVSLSWRPRDRALETREAATLARAVAAADGFRIVLEVGGDGESSPPLDAASRGEYCGYLAGLLRLHPTLGDVVVWTEPNQPTFWPSPSADRYEALLARCYDLLHAVRPHANVIASTGPHARIPGAVAPAQWHAQLGAALRAGSRRRPLFDTLGHNVYPDSPSEVPSRQHAGPSIDEGDYARLAATVRTAFHRHAAAAAQSERGVDLVPRGRLSDDRRHARPLHRCRECAGAACTCPASQSVGGIAPARRLPAPRRRLL
jgi:hypothetical protein